MSKRLTRIAAGKLIQRGSELTYRDISVVLLNGHTVYGTLVSLTSEALTVKDKRDHSHSTPLSDIYEVVYDSK